MFRWELAFVAAVLIFLIITILPDRLVDETRDSRSGTEGSRKSAGQKKWHVDRYTEEGTVGSTESPLDSQTTDSTTDLPPPAWDETSKFLRSGNCGSASHVVSGERILDEMRARNPSIMSAPKFEDLLESMEDNSKERTELAETTHRLYSRSRHSLNISASWPWLAAYGYTGHELQQIMGWYCAGSLVTARSTITSARCLEDPAEDGAKLRYAHFGDADMLGNNDGEQPSGITVEVSGVVKHPEFDPFTYIHDIAIVFLKTPVTFTESIIPICLPFGLHLTPDQEAGYDVKHNRNNPEDRVEFRIAGWGFYRYGAIGGLLLDARTKPVSNRKCAEAYEMPNIRITEDQMCAGDGTDACTGDMGGPLMLLHSGKYYAVGVMSLGYSCLSHSYPGVSTRISTHLNWLEHHINII